ncbi:hypothetical protein AVEN_151471-1, partial [Araneus ventricosus]
EKFRQVIHGYSRVCFDTPYLRRFKVPDLFPPFLLLPHTGDFRIYFQHDLASSWGPNLGSGLVFQLPSQRGVQRPPDYSNLISNYSEFQHFKFSTPNSLGFHIDEWFVLPVIQKSWSGPAVNVPLKKDVWINPRIPKRFCNRIRSFFHLDTSINMWECY